MWIVPDDDDDDDDEDDEEDNDEHHHYEEDGDDDHLTAISFAIPLMCFFHVTQFIYHHYPMMMTIWDGMIFAVLGSRATHAATKGHRPCMDISTVAIETRETMLNHWMCPFLLPIKKIEKQRG